MRNMMMAVVLAVLGAAPLQAQVSVRNDGMAQELDVPMSRAKVVESARPFAEISVADPGIADISTLSERSIYVLGKAPGRTTMTLLDEGGGLIANVEISVSPDVSELKERLRAVLPGEPIEVRTANDGLLLSGTVSSSAALDRAVELASRYAPDRVSNLMSVAGSQQVMLKVRFAEMSRSVRKALSASLAVNGVSYDGDFGGYGGNGDLADGAAISDLFDKGTASGLGGGERSGALSIGVGAGNVEFAVLLEALETNGFVRTLAEPNLSALSGQEAEFLAGGEIPIPVVGSEGEVTVTFKPVGVQLTFVPHVVGQSINLQLAAEVSSVDPTRAVRNGGFTINAFSTRNASSTVEMRDGESFAIAGLLQDDFRSENGKVPWLGDLPVLGTLFRSSEYEREQSELVIIVTAHLVTPKQGPAFALPTDRVRPPTERELFLHGKVAASNAPLTGAAAEVARQDFRGSYGYVME